MGSSVFDCTSQTFHSHPPGSRITVEYDPDEPGFVRRGPGLADDPTFGWLGSSALIFAVGAGMAASFVGSARRMALSATSGTTDSEDDGTELEEEIPAESEG